MSALVNYFGNGSYSYANTTARLYNYSILHKVNLCPSATPLALSNGSCVACNQTDYYVDLQTMQCVKAVTISNFPLLRASKVIQLGSANLTNL